MSEDTAQIREAIEVIKESSCTTASWFIHPVFFNYLTGRSRPYFMYRKERRDIFIPQRIKPMYFILEENGVITHEGRLQ